MQALEKNTLRAHMLARRKELSAESCAEVSLVIQEHLLQSEVWQQAQQVGLYMAKGREVQTQHVVQRAWQEGKKVFLPLCHTELRGHMDFVYCENMDDVALGAYGIYEPTPEAWQRHKHAYAAQGHSLALDILLVPGVAFDTLGYRIGFGGGYYDRFLQAKQQGYIGCCIGAAFSWQVVERISCESWDMPVQALLSEEGLRWI